MTKKLVLVVLLLGICFPRGLQAQGVATSAVPFLLIAPNSRASALGESGVATADDAWAIYWNPAGFAFQQGSEVSMTHANWLPAFGMSDLWIAHMVYKQPVEQVDGIVAVGITYLNLGEFNRTLNDPTVIETFKGYEFAITLGYGTKISEQLGLGINARLISSHLAPFGTAEEQGRGVATGFGFDVGLLYRPNVVRIPFTGFDIGHHLNLGMNLANIGPKLTYIDKAQADPLPLTLRLGLAYKILESEYNNLTYDIEVSRLMIKRNSDGTSDEFYKAFFTTWTTGNFNEQLRQFDTGMGLEYWYGFPKLIALRIGYFYEDPRAGNRKFMTFGAGIRYDIYGFDFGYINAFEDQDPLGGTLRFSLSIAWGGEAQ